MTTFIIWTILWAIARTFETAVSVYFTYINPTYKSYKSLLANCYLERVRANVSFKDWALYCTLGSVISWILLPIELFGLFKGSKAFIKGI